MVQRGILGGVVLTLLTVGGITASACGGAEDTTSDPLTNTDGGTAGTAGGAAGGAGVPGGGGSGNVATGGGSGNTPGRGGDGNTGGAPPAGTCGGFMGTMTQCADAECVDVASLGAKPCSLCPHALCLPKSLVAGSNPEQADQLADCPEDPTNKCVPEGLISTKSKVALKKCASILGAEGACISICIPQVAAQKDRLPVDVCDAESERCAPCFDPRTCLPSSACQLGCTDGGKDPPKCFDKCCSGSGSCVPPDLAGDQAAQLNADTCPDTTQLCAPDDVASGAKPTPCNSLGGGEGRCLSKCLNQIKEQLATLPPDVCPETHLCAPCFDPRTGEPTEACKQNGDAPDPARPVYVFPPCCGGEGKCAPLSALKPEQATSLKQQDCADAQSRCAPKKAVEDQGGGAFTGNPLCQTAATGGPLGLGGIVASNKPGICAPACFHPDPSTTSGTMFGQANCPTAGTVCLPCANPQTNAETGACPPAAPPPP